MLLKFSQYHFAKSDKQLKSLNQSFSIEWLERLQFKYVLIQYIIGAGENDLF